MIQQAISNSVILAENDPQMRDLIRAVLVNARQLVFPAADGLEAVQLARQFRPRVILLDIAMPRLNGLEACRMIRELPGYAEVPILMLTGHTEAKTVRLARKLGATDLIAKPFRPHDLLARLASWLDIPDPVLATASGEAFGDEAAPAPNAAAGRSERTRSPSAADNPRLPSGREAPRLARAARGG